MKEITRIHLAKTPYEIEINAKKDLEKYLAEIEKNMQADADAMREIEARMVEILAERGVKSDGVVAADDVAAIKQTLGGSEEFAGDEVTPSKRAESIDGDKKLMRDIDNAWVGGVGSGVAAYFGVDVLIVRAIILVLMIVSFGTFLFVYLLLWLLVPPAKTAADKLRMRGRQVTLESLKDTSSASDGRTAAGRMISVIIRVIVATMLAFAAIGALIATIFGGLFGFAALSFFGGTDQVWVSTLIGSLIIGGLALTTVLAIATYGVAALRLTKVAKIGLVTALIVGFVTIPIIGISAPQLDASFSNGEKEMIVTIPDEKAEGATSLHIKGARPAILLDDTKSDSMTAKIVYRERVFNGMPKISFERQGDVLLMTVDGNYNDSCDLHAVVMEYCQEYGIERIEVDGQVKNLNAISDYEIDNENSN